MTPPSELVDRYNQTVGQIADLADTVADFRPLANQRVMLCLAAACEIIARTNDDRVVDVYELRRAFDCFVRSMKEGNMRGRAKRTAEQPRDPLNLCRVSDPG